MTEIQNSKQLAFDLNLRFRYCNLVLVFCYFRFIRVKQEVRTIYVGFANLIASQQLIIKPKIANPTRLAADHRLNPTYDLSFRSTNWVPYDSI